MLLAPVLALCFVPLNLATRLFVRLADRHLVGRRRLACPARAVGVRLPVYRDLVLVRRLAVPGALGLSGSFGFRCVSLRSISLCVSTLTGPFAVRDKTFCLFKSAVTQD
jgi:hypothetical protein